MELQTISQVSREYGISPRMLRAWDFEDWRRLGEWVSASDNTLTTGALRDGNQRKRRRDRALKKR